MKDSFKSIKFALPFFPILAEISLIALMIGEYFLLKMSYGFIPIALAISVGFAFIVAILISKIFMLINKRVYAKVKLPMAIQIDARNAMANYIKSVSSNKNIPTNDHMRLREALAINNIEYSACDNVVMNYLHKHTNNDIYYNQIQKMDDIIRKSCFVLRIFFYIFMILAIFIVCLALILKIYFIIPFAIFFIANAVFVLRIRNIIFNCFIIDSPWCCPCCHAIGSEKTGFVSERIGVTKEYKSKDNYGNVGEVFIGDKKVGNITGYTGSTDYQRDIETHHSKYQLYCYCCTYTYSNENTYKTKGFWIKS